MKIFFTIFLLKMDTILSFVLLQNVWDKDPLSQEKMGHVTFTLAQLREKGKVSSIVYK